MSKERKVGYRVLMRLLSALKVPWGIWQRLFKKLNSNSTQSKRRSSRSVPLLRSHNRTRKVRPNLPRPRERHLQKLTLFALVPIPWFRRSIGAFCLHCANSGNDFFKAQVEFDLKQAQKTKKEIIQTLTPDHRRSSQKNL